MGGSTCDNHPIFDAVKDFFCFSNSSCGYSPSRKDDTVEHNKKVAGELAEMLKNYSEKSKNSEMRILQNTNKNLDMLILDLAKCNQITYGGKKLNLNIDGIKNEMKKIEKQVNGFVEKKISGRLVLTDPELEIILKESDDEKRGKCFQEFCKKVESKAVSDLADVINKSVRSQIKLIENEINTRIKEVEKNIQDSLNSYVELAELKEKDTFENEKAKAKHIYKVGLCDVMLDILSE